MTHCVNVAKLAEAGRNQIYVPIGAGKTKEEYGSFEPLQSAERETLRLFPNIMLAVEGSGMPIEVYLINGSSLRLSLRPSPGGMISLPTRIQRYYCGAHEIVIYRDPSPSEDVLFVEKRPQRDQN